MSHRVLVAAALSILTTAAAAQIAHPGRPASAVPGATALAPLSDVPMIVLPHPDIERLKAEDAGRDDLTLRYGAVIPTTLSSDEVGAWQELPSGELVWRVRLVSPGARSLGVLFDRYDLPADGELYLYDPARATVLGAFTRETRQPNGMLAVQPVAGDDLVIEYVQPAADAARPALRIGEVVHDYLGILDRLDPENEIALGGGGCLTDINCPPGAAYTDIKRSVIMVLNGGGLCSAGLLNNTAQDATPYFLTANHCGNMANVVAVFLFERTGCGSGTSSTSRTVSGATLLADSTNYDSQLYRLSSAPPANYQPFYAGWDRAMTQQPGPGISISHPNGLPKKIARDDNNPTNSGTEWIAIWELGKLEPGSSGSPFFNGEKKVLGPACCVSTFTCNSQFSFYGKIGGFWVEDDLQTWLDPLGQDPESIAGHDPFQALAVPYFGSNTNPFAYTSTTLPTLGTTWIAEVEPDVGNVTTTIIGYTAPDSGFFIGAGEVLIDLGTPRLLLSSAPVVSGSSVHSNAIPNDAALSGLSLFTQALRLGGGNKSLTNGIELRLR